ncbi:MAG: response regulator transcription factor [Actinomycetota bacterium]|nr:response regulator transcription factor [Actinomycetota bacterium]
MAALVHEAVDPTERCASTVSRAGAQRRRRSRSVPVVREHDAYLGDAYAGTSVQDGRDAQGQTASQPDLSVQRAEIGYRSPTPTGDNPRGRPGETFTSAKLHCVVTDPSESRLRILIAEDQYLMREGTRRLLAEVPGIDVVGEASDFDSVLAEARRLKPDVVLMDIKMPPTHSMEGIEAAHVIRNELPDIGVVVLSQHEDEGYVWALLERGVAGYGYLHKVRVGDVDQLVRALREVAAGGSVLDPRILQTLLDRRSKKPGSPLSELSAGELDVLRLMAQSRSNSAIASQLSIAVGTVEKRIAAIFSKLGVPAESDVNRRVAAVLIYLRESLPDS